MGARGWGAPRATELRPQPARSPAAASRAEEEGGPGVRGGGSGSRPRLPGGGSTHGAGWRRTGRTVWPPGGTWWCGTCGECSWPAAWRPVLPPTPSTRPEPGAGMGRVHQAPRGGPGAGASKTSKALGALWAASSSKPLPLESELSGTWHPLGASEIEISRKMAQVPTPSLDLFCLDHFTEIQEGF